MFSKRIRVVIQIFLQPSVFFEVGAGCIDHSLNWMPGSPVIQSYEVTKCSNLEGHVEVVFRGYQEAACSGTAELFTSGNDIAIDKCYSNSTQLSCQSEPISLTEVWPAIDIYFEDGLCKTSAVTVSLRPGCVSMFENIFALQCNSDGSVMNFETYATSMTCADNVPLNSFSFATEECISYMIGKAHRHGTPLNEFFENTLLSLVPVTGGKIKRPYNGYYMARCNGY